MKYSKFKQIRYTRTFNPILSGWRVITCYHCQQRFLMLVLWLALLPYVQIISPVKAKESIKEARTDSNLQEPSPCLKKVGLPSTTASKIPGNEPLFLKADIQKDVNKPPGPMVIRLRYDKINVHALSQPNACLEEVYTEKVILNLFPEISYTAINRAINVRAQHDFTWIGALEGLPLSDVTLVVNGDNVTGNINAEGTVYWLRPSANHIHLIAETNPSAFPLGSSQNHPVSKKKQPAKPRKSSPPGDRKSSLLFPHNDPITMVMIEVMVVYTPVVAQASYDIVSEILLAVEETNTAYLNSGIYQQLRLVHTEQINYTESGSHFTDLKLLTYSKDQSQPGEGDLHKVHSLRNTHNADLVSLWVEKGDSYTCGVSWLLLPESTPREKFGFNVVERYCASAPSYSFAHELGHNMGATHDKYATDYGVGGGTVGAYNYSHGYVHIDGAANSWRTIMASDKQCLDKGYECPRIPFFSNPNIFYKGVAIGDDIANNSLTLNNAVTTVAEFRLSATQLAEKSKNSSSPGKANVAVVTPSVSMADKKP
jgi:hypothetical protein